MFSEIVSYVVKRDGRTVPFDDDFILTAIEKAMTASSGGKDDILADVITKNVTGALEVVCGNAGTDTVTVEQIHDLVEEKLMRSSRKDAAQAYIRYREKRNLARKADSMAIFESIVRAQANDITRENANMNADTPAGMMMKFASESSKAYAVDALLSDDVKEAVREGLLHIHDLDYYATRSLTCLQHPLDIPLSKGFVSGHASARPAKRIETAAFTACITMETIQNEMHGGQAIPAFDFYLAPFVRKAFEEEVDRLMESAELTMTTRTLREEILAKRIVDYISAPVSRQQADDEKAFFPSLVERYWQMAVNRTVRRVHQAMESFVHNMNNIHSRGGNQVVFSSINYGTDTSPEGRCIIREILNTTYEGVGNGETAIFPIQIWKKKRGVSYLPEDPNYDLYRYACKVSARRFFPNFLNLDADFNRDDAWRADDPKRYLHEVATMGCRTRVYENRFGEKTSVGRGNLSFSTINLPGLALRVMDRPAGEEREKAFFESLDRILDVTAQQLDERMRFQSTAVARQFPMLMSGMWTGSGALFPDDSVAEVIRQGTLGIGFIGLAEALIALTGYHHAESAEAQALGIRIITRMRDRAADYCEIYQHNYSVLATPAEGLSGKFTLRDRKRFGVVPGVTDKDYYTNSNHVPVYYKCTPEEKARIEAPYHDLTRGGHIFYVEMDADATHNPEAVMAVVDLMDRYGIGYGSVNHNRIRCLDCGYESAQIDGKTCPRCGGERLDILQRITGYLVGTTERWNSGKKAELRDRVVHE